jgi:hypothetical protein
MRWQIIADSRLHLTVIALRNTNRINLGRSPGCRENARLARRGSGPITFPGEPSGVSIGSAAMTLRSDTVAGAAQAWHLLPV